MKKVLFMIVLIILTLSLVSYQDHYPYSVDGIEEIVENIEIHYIYNQDTSILVYTLDQDEIPIFFDELGLIRMSYPLGDSLSVSGYTFYIYYTNGTYETLSANGTIYYTSDNVQSSTNYRVCDEHEFAQLVGLFYRSSSK